MSKAKSPTTVSQPAHGEIAPHKGIQHAKFTVLRGKQNLHEAIRDGMAHISNSAFRIPAAEIETGIEETQAAFLKRIIAENPRQRPRDPSENCLTEEQIEEVEGVRVSEELIPTNALLQPKPLRKDIWS